MKTFKQFNEESKQKLDEALPLAAAIPALVKFGSAALTAYSAGSAINNARKGKWGKAGLDVVGAIPAGRVFRGLKTLGAGKRLAQAGSVGHSLTRHGTDNAFSRAYGKVWDTGAKMLGLGGDPAKANNKTNTNTNTNTKTNTKTNTTTPSKTKGPAKTAAGKLRLASGRIAS